MKTFAIIENEIVVNVIVAESFKIAKDLFGDKVIIEITEERLGGIGATWDGKKFKPAKPEGDWVYNDNLNTWLPGVEAPVDHENYYYDGTKWVLWPVESLDENNI